MIEAKKAAEAKRRLQEQKKAQAAKIAEMKKKQALKIAEEKKKLE